MAKAESEATSVAEPAAQKPAGPARVPSGTTVSGRSLVVVASTIGLALVAAVVLSFRQCGQGRFVNGSVAVEGRIKVAEISRGIVGCMVRDRATDLPPSARSVPEDITATHGDGYTSTAADWDQPVYRCAGFSIQGPQRYRYTWRRDSADEGLVRADADRDGDGTPETVFEMPIRCQGQGEARGCGAGKIEERGVAPH